MLIVEEVVGIFPVDQNFVIEDDDNGERSYEFFSEECIWDMDDSLLSREVKMIMAEEDIIIITI